jgi:hypothetical protein
VKEKVAPADISRETGASPSFRMKHLFRSLLTVCLLAAGSALAQTHTPNPAGISSTSKKEKVTKLDGTSFLGIVTLTDDYTLKISNDAGIFKVPLALLGESDFKKYTGGKDRSGDGKLWSERKEALENQKEENSEGGSKNTGATDNSAIEIQLGEIAVFQPVISVYEATLGNKTDTAKSSASEKQEGESENGGTQSANDANPVRLFSGPGAGGLPYNGIGSSVVQPVMSVGGSVLQSAGGVVPSAPVSVPGAP